MIQAVEDLIRQFLARPSSWHIRLAKEWSSIIGPLAEHMRLERVTSDDTVIIGVYDVHWMQELYLLSRTIVRTINTALDGEHVRALHFKIVMRPEKKTEAQSKPAYTPPPMRQLTTRERLTLNNITDEQLKQSLQAFLERSIRIQSREKKAEKSYTRHR